MEGKGKRLPLGNEVKIIDREKQWRIKCLKESKHMLSYSLLVGDASVKGDVVF